jgi:drug/metabolite transporter (DMT)-like permease
VKELLGAAVAVLSAILYDLGYVFEKKALDRLPPVQATPIGMLRVARTSRRWLAGFCAMAAGLLLQVGALTLAPVSVVLPILAGGLIALAVVGASLLGESLNRRHRAALVLVLVAVVAVAASAHSSDRLARHVPEARFFGVIVVVGCVALVAARTGLGPRHRTAPGVPLSALFWTALGAGLMYGLGALSEKAVATRLVHLGLIRGAASSLLTAYPWVFVAATLAGMLTFQVGLQSNPASLMASFTNVTSMVCGVLGASLVFGEAVLPPGWWSLLRVVGFAAVVGSVVLLVIDGEPVPTPGESRRSRPDHAVAP